jgi:hypothetical protein
MEEALSRKVPKEVVQWKPVQRWQALYTKDRPLESEAVRKGERLHREIAKFYHRKQFAIFDDYSLRDLPPPRFSSPVITLALLGRPA